MSQLPEPPRIPSAPAPPASGAVAQGAGGLAIAAIVIAVLGFCLPPIGLVGVILGVIALTRGTVHSRVLPIAAIFVGSLSVVASVALMVAILLPALGRARTMAVELRQQLDMQLIASERLRSQFDGETEGVKDYDLQKQLAVAPAVWVPEVPIAPGAGTAYLLIAPTDPAQYQSFDPKLALLVENPKVFDRDGLAVAYADGHVERVPRLDAEALLAASKGRVFNTDGTPWEP